MKPLLAQIEAILKDEFTIPDELCDYVLEIIRYNVVGGKMIRGLFAVYTAYAMCGEWNEEMKEQFVRR